MVFEWHSKSVGLLLKNRNKRLRYIIFALAMRSSTPLILWNLIFECFYRVHADDDVGSLAFIF